MGKFTQHSSLFLGVRPRTKETQYLSYEVLTSLENSTHDLLTIFNKLEGEQKECSKCEDTSVIGKRN